MDGSELDVLTSPSMLNFPKSPQLLFTILPVFPTFTLSPRISQLYPILWQFPNFSFGPTGVSFGGWWSSGNLKSWGIGVSFANCVKLEEVRLVAKLCDFGCLKSPNFHNYPNYSNFPNYPNFPNFHKFPNFLNFSNFSNFPDFPILLKPFNFPNFPTPIW